MCSLAPHPFLSLSKPFTKRTLISLRNAIRDSTLNKPGILADSSASPSRDAAVLIPFCNVNDVPGILFEVRGKTLRSHSGEISFPGGRIDSTDKSFLAGALRETREELGIAPNRVEVLGELGPAEVNLRGNMRVWPYVAFVHGHRIDEKGTLDTPLSSIDLDDVWRNRSLEEVASVFHLPLQALASPVRLKASKFRGGWPYWAVDVSDLVEAEKVVHGDTEFVDEVGCGREGRIEIWGLTGWYLSLLTRILQIHS